MLFLCEDNQLSGLLKTTWNVENGKRNNEANSEFTRSGNKDKCDPRRASEISFDGL